MKKGAFWGLYNRGYHERDLLHEVGKGEDEATVIEIVDQIIKRGYHQRASDIHFEHYQNRFRVRLRVDGLLEEGPSLPYKLILPVVSRIKVMANLDIGEKRLPQEGYIFYPIDTGKGLHIRVSIIPTSQGEKAVLRLLPDKKDIYSLNELGFTPLALERINSLIHVPYGMILVTGPTGCGKTTTLYSMMKCLNSVGRNIISIEDPIECEIEGINQVFINPEIGLDFSKGLRAILRQDPDVIMIGEIRDKETAEIAARVATTGCLVLTSLHTRDAAGAITRLLDLGVPRYLVAASVVGIVAQRLVGKICPECRMEADYSESVLSHLSLPFFCQGKTFYQKKGCSQCHNKGYKGRVLLHEILAINENVQNLIYGGISENKLREISKQQGMKTLWEDGLEKAIAGETTLEEVMRVTCWEKSVIKID